MKDPYNAILTSVDSKGTIGHKDLFLTRGVETTAASNLLEGYIPQYSATVVGLLDKAGYKTKAKLNCDAWAHGSSGENSDFGPTKNPWNEQYTPGGSSSGSAVAVAAGLVDYATGTDTGGSIRLPASFTNMTALKPTYGAVSRYGIIAMASSLDSPGIFARSVRDVKKLFSVISKKDMNDATSRSVGRTNYVKQVKTIGIPKEFVGEGVSHEVKGALLGAAKEFEKTGVNIIDVTLPNTKYGISAYYVIMATEVASNLARYDGIRYGHDRSHLGAEAKRRIMLGTFSSSAGYTARFYEKAARVRTLLIKDFEKAFDPSAYGADILLGPISPTPPFKLGEKTDNPLEMYLSDVLTVTVNLAGLPGLALPCGFSKNGLPIGMQLIGPRWSEETLFTVGEKYQKLTDWHKRNPTDGK